MRRALLHAALFTLIACTPVVATAPGWTSYATYQDGSRLALAGDWYVDYAVSPWSQPCVLYVIELYCPSGSVECIARDIWNDPSIRLPWCPSSAGVRPPWRPRLEAEISPADDGGVR